MHRLFINILIMLLIIGCGVKDVSEIADGQYFNYQKINSWRFRTGEGSEYIDLSIDKLADANYQVSLSMYGEDDEIIKEDTWNVDNFYKNNEGKYVDLVHGGVLWIPNSKRKVGKKFEINGNKLRIDGKKYWDKWNVFIVKKDNIVTQELQVMPRDVSEDSCGFVMPCYYYDQENGYFVGADLGNVETESKMILVDASVKQLL